MTRVEVGTLTDQQIEEHLKKGELIAENSDPKQIRQACYELRSGTVYFDLTNGGERHDASQEGDILIKPHHLVVIMTHEVMQLPDDIVGRILTKGSLFSLGLSPVNTYADPGFSGKLGIVTFNTSQHYIGIPLESSIAKIEFSRLRDPVNRPYSGQHGFETSIWPIRTDLIMTADQIKQDSRILHPLDELTAQHGEVFSRLIKRIFRYERRLLSFAFILLTVNLLVIWRVHDTEFQNLATGVVLGIISNLFSILITYFVTSIRS